MMEDGSHVISLKQCIGKEVIDNVGNKCGTIKDFLINPLRSKALFVLISEGGFLGTGIGSDYMVAPVQTLRFDNPEAAQYGLKVAPEKVKKAPRLPKSDIGIKDKEDPLLQEIMEYYGLEMNFIRPGKIYEGGYEHQSYQGASQITGNAPENNEKISDEMAYDKIKGIDKEKGESKTGE